MKLLNYQPHQKITYSAGLISLVLLPVLCLCWLYQHKAFEQHRIVDIRFYSPEWRNSLPKEVQFEFPPKRDYIHINLIGDVKEDKISLDFARNVFKRLRETKDTLKAVKFNFGNKAKYWTFISAIDICQTEDVPWFMPYKNNMYCIYPTWYFQTKLKSIYSLESDIVTYPPTTFEITERIWNENLMFLNYAIEDYWMIFLTFTGILVLSAINWKRNYYKVIA